MISRRDFLKAAGITLFAAHVPGFIAQTAVSAAPTFDPLYGRLLTGRDGLWADSVIPIHAILANSYQTPHGVIAKRHLQPMLTPALYQSVSREPPFTAEVVGARAVLRRYCAAEADPEGSVGHGGLLNVVDRLNHNGVDWYGVQNGGRVLWTHSAPLAPLAIPAALPNLTLHIDQAERLMTVMQGDHPLFSTAVADKQPYLAGEYQVNRHTLIAQLHRNEDAPFVTTFGEGLHIYGAYWHNRFGEQWSSEGIEVPPYVAKWIYGATQGGARVMIT